MTVQSSSLGVTDWLQRWNNGNEEARQVIFELIYRELRTSAASLFRNERRDHTLQPTALVHEACLRLIGESDIHWHNRSHFLGIASRVMRQVLVDYSREKNAAKRGGELQRIPLPESLRAQEIVAVEIVALDHALTRLEELDPEQARIVEVRFFAGLSVIESADYLGVSATTVKRQWRRARAWLHAELKST